MKIGLIFLAGFFFSLAAPLFAQADDPSEVFLKAYMTSQQGEKLEHDNQLQSALAKFRFAGSLLDELRKTHSEWQPAIVEYRSRKIGENILRVEGKIATQKDLAANSDAGPVQPPALPGNDSSESRAPTSPKTIAPEPTVEISPPQASEAQMPPPKSDGLVAETPARKPSEAAIKEATKTLREKIDQLQTELKKSRNQYSAVEQEKETLNGRLQETNSKLQKTESELATMRAAEKQLRGQLATAQESLEKLHDGGDAKAQEALRSQIAQLKKSLASAEEGRAAAEKETASANAKLAEANQQIASVTKERNELIEQIRAGKEAADHVQALVSENSTLKQKLADTEKTLREISDDKPQKEQEIAEVKRQVEQLHQQLAASQKQNQVFETTIADLRSQLEEAGNELSKAKLTGANAEETSRLTKENEVLRRIVLREQQEEARRDQAKKLMLAEFEKLEIKSEALNQQIEFIAQPVMKLTPDELALLRQPVVALSDTPPGGVTASFAVAKQDESAGAALPPGATAAAKNDAGPSVQTTVQTGVPPELASVAREAKQNFDNKKYRAAEREYQQILAKSPNNLYSLSNLAVVYFRTGKLKAAELTLKKAVTLAPKDEFSHRTLGIVYYGQSKFDDAVTELTKALALNPKSAIAHNYLGITASQKGWQEAAEKEMLDAISENPDYADAHYNLAVIYATAQPPAKELAKLHYAKATSLGAEADPSLEKLIR